MIQLSNARRFCHLPPLKRGVDIKSNMYSFINQPTKSLNYETQILSTHPNPHVPDNMFNLNPPAFGDLDDACQFPAAGDGLRANPPVEIYISRHWNDDDKRSDQCHLSYSFEHGELQPWCDGLAWRSKFWHPKCGAVVRSFDQSYHG